MEFKRGSICCLDVEKTMARLSSLRVLDCFGKMLRVKFLVNVREMNEFFFGGCS
jgi:hypothetical protein